MKYLLALAFALAALPAGAAENVMPLGKEQVQPDISAEFRAEAPDTILPEKIVLTPKQSDILLLGIVRWEGNALTGFVPGLQVTAHIVSDDTGKRVDYLLSPHIGAKDGLHYARNVKLPGPITDNYSIDFTLAQPRPGDLLYRSDWAATHTAKLLAEPKTFTYKHLNFSGISPRLQ